MLKLLLCHEKKTSRRRAIFTKLHGAVLADVLKQWVALLHKMWPTSLQAEFRWIEKLEFLTVNTGYRE